MKMIQISWIESNIPQLSTDDWTFNGASTRELTHCYHDYPARMIPQVAGKLLDLFAPSGKLLFDPYCGSGTSLVEANIRGIHAVGTDLNPLARLIAQAKTARPDLEILNFEIEKFKRGVMDNLKKKWLIREGETIEGISNLEFWFKPEVIQKLLLIKAFIRQIDDKDTALFFKVAFSETVRESSNTRNNEFKLYRYDEKKLASHKPDVEGIMLEKLQRNLRGYNQYKAILDNLKYPPSTKVYGFNSVNEIPEDYLLPNSVDIVVTSPPYGDSGTTVAYGQYSRLSAAWLGLEEPHKIDRKLMGGQSLREIPLFPSNLLNQAILQIQQKDEKRARQVAAFYKDLLLSITHVAQTIRKGGYACYVVGNRKVKGVILPTDIAIRNFFEENGFVHVHTYMRQIPNKRMPSKNSPSNRAGKLDDTMTREYIVVMKRPL
jgi:tRNA G10  N-methylase Trm11